MRTLVVSFLLFLSASARAQPAHVDSLGTWTPSLEVYVDSARAGTSYVFSRQQSVTIVADTVWIGCPELGNHHFTIRQFAAQARDVALGRDTTFTRFHEWYQCTDVLRPLWQHRSGTR
jgi:hypothetical protein